MTQTAANIDEVLATGYRHGCVTQVEADMVPHGLTKRRLAMHVGLAAADLRASVLLRKILDKTASAQEAQEFGMVWQKRVDRLLIDHADDPDLIVAATSAV